MSQFDLVVKRMEVAQNFNGTVSKFDPEARTVMLHKNLTELCQNMTLKLEGWKLHKILTEPCQNSNRTMSKFDPEVKGKYCKKI